MTHSPTFHFEAGRLVEIDRIRADERSPIIVDHVFFFCIDNTKPRSERKARPIRGRAHHVVTGKISAEGVVATASFTSGIGSCAHFLHPPQVSGGSGMRLPCWVFRTTDEKTSNSNTDGKVKAFWRLQHRGLNSIDGHCRTSDIVDLCRAQLVIGPGSCSRKYSTRWASRTFSQTPFSGTRILRVNCINIGRMPIPLISRRIIPSCNAGSASLSQESSSRTPGNLLRLAEHSVWGVSTY